MYAPLFGCSMNLKSAYVQLVGRVTTEMVGQARATGRSGALVERDVLFPSTLQRLRVMLLASSRGSKMTERRLGLELACALDGGLSKERLWALLNDLAADDAGDGCDPLDEG